MVSIRRRKLLGLCSGRHSLLVQFPRVSDNGTVSGTFVQDTKLVGAHPLPAVNVNQPEEINIAKAGPGSSNVSGSSTSKEEQNQQFSGQGIKCRKRHRRKHFENQEPCIMRGVYFKNLKWQAAIKVEKKQIHLGTVGSQEAAARLYDRAAFMCGREPNFELPEEEKQELRRFKWDEFLTMTRNSITNKKHQKRHGNGSQKKSQAAPQSNNLHDDGFSALEENVERHLPVS